MLRSILDSTSRRTVQKGNEMTVRRRYNVGVHRITPGSRDLFRDVVDDNDERGWFDVINASDDGEIALGAEVVYSLELTDDEAARFKQASNVRYVEEDGYDTIDLMTIVPDHVTPINSTVPTDDTLRYMGAIFPGSRDFHGRDVLIAVLDGGTTDAVRARFKWNVVASRNFVHGTEPTKGITVEHGCYVTPEAVPAGGQLIECVVFGETGAASHATFATAVRWACDKGAQVINYSGSSDRGSMIQQDAIRYAQERGVAVVCSAGNTGKRVLDYPAKLCELFPNVFSSIAFVEVTDLRADFSNYLNTGSGCAPGSRCLSVDKNATNVRWSGTSSSAPKMTRLIAMGASGGRFTTLVVARALVVNARNTAEPTDEEGAGAWYLANALLKLGVGGPWSRSTGGVLSDHAANVERPRTNVVTSALNVVQHVTDFVRLVLRAARK